MTSSSTVRFDSPTRGLPNIKCIKYSKLLARTLEALLVLPEMNRAVGLGFAFFYRHHFFPTAPPISFSNSNKNLVFIPVPIQLNSLLLNLIGS